MPGVVVLAGVKEANPDLSLWTANERLKEAKATGAEALVTSCPWCERNFKDAIEQYGEEIEIYDIAEITRKAI
jgi:Fe-S oxidoreductase